MIPGLWRATQNLILNQITCNKYVTPILEALVLSALSKSLILIFMSNPELLKTLNKIQKFNELAQTGAFEAILINW